MKIDASRRGILTGRWRKASNGIRPPWSGDESHFLTHCTRCDACINACENNILQRGAGGYPSVNFKNNECSFCYACAQACPESLFSPRHTRAWDLQFTIGDACLAYQSVECRRCQDSCEPMAIIFRPTLSGIDLMSSTTTSNVMPMMHVGLDNFDLVKYLVSQVMLSEEDRFEALKEYYPQAKKEDWRLWQAGQRVQIIKRDAEKGGVLRLGTEVVSDQQGTIAALLGASPGASTAAPIMLNLLEKVFGDRVSSPQWQATLKAIVPSYGRKLNGDVAATERELQYTSEVLGLNYDKPQAADSTPKPQLKPQPVQKEVADIAL